MDFFGILLEFLRILARKAGIRPEWFTAAWSLVRRIGRVLGRELWAGLVILAAVLRTVGGLLGRVLGVAGDALLKAMVVLGRWLDRATRGLSDRAARAVECLAALVRGRPFPPGRKAGNAPEEGAAPAEPGCEGEGAGSAFGPDWTEAFWPPPGTDGGGQGGLRRPGPRALLLALAGVLAAAALAWGLHLAGLAPWESRPREAVPANATEESGPHALRRPVSATAPAYEEFPGDDLEERIKRTDLALFETLAREKIGPSGLALVDVQVRRRQDRDYHFQALQIGTKTPGRFVAGLRAGLAARAANATLEQTGRLAYRVRIDGVETHRLSLSLSPILPSAGTRAPQTASDPRMAIVIDDMGEDLDFARGLGGLPLPVAFSIWPEASKARETARLADRLGRDVLVHQPMEPRGNPRVTAGRNVLTVNMSRPQIQAQVRASLDKVPGAKGLNNHMGSRFTEWGPGMRAVLEVLESRNLFFLDSMTTQGSVGRQEAARAGTRYLFRDLFLDNVAQVEAVTHQLRLAERLALATGKALVIGHPYPQTLAALRVWAKNRDTRVAVVPITGLGR